MTLAKMHRRGAPAALAVLLAASAGAVGAERTLTVASGFPDSAVPPYGHHEVAKFLEANSDLRADVQSLGLLTLAEMSPGIRDGIADMGYVLTPYFAAEYSETNMAADMTLLVQKGVDAPGLAMVAAMTEYVLLNCPDCQAEYLAQNQVFLGGGASTEYSLVCNRPITSPADLKGLSLRSGASVFGRWAEHFGAIKVAIPGSEMYEALAQNVVQCTMVGLPDAINFQLTDVTSHIVKNAPGGVFAGAASLDVNLDLWRELDADQRSVLLDAGALMTAATAVEYYRQGVKAEKTLAEAGVTIVTADEAGFTEATQAFLADDMKTIETQFGELYGVENVAAKMETMRGLIEKWKDKVAEVDPSDLEGFRDLLKAEIYAKIDRASYGMN
ncbi:C4-dicarboxylate TRAP transporter substrate-binding protein [Albimonas sp. CAU 1670]|uniref:C4-dicarboxylate TRAP transporter substrate-binding protein n=1 Tax=Albimonas sp. CAU 1670 TaxID=3032599 RepID=UPI0023DB0D37|nr:C4-dicarboxylate TRAP transporter substrate-binding protein [Albimonas sp. CAU 1670]MDF2235704.1 C4-dicarboxylate TRAP transporter substrate-binding protein [Albimonas sp. CAU 1670]